MPILHVRNIPDELYARLQRRAEVQRRSLSAEVLTLLEWAIEEAERTSEATLTSIRRRRSFNPDAAGAPDSTTLLRQDRGGYRCPWSLPTRRWCAAQRKPA